MTSSPFPFELTVVVRLLAEPSLWYWEIHDKRRNVVLQCSWRDHWMGYRSLEEAVGAGLQRASQWGVDLTPVAHGGAAA